jgi:hypothetical protein
MTMRIRFTRAGYAVAAGIAATAMLGLSAAANASVAAKPAATNACGRHCVNVSFVNPGRHYLLASHSGLNVKNNLIVLTHGSNGAAKEDFTEIRAGSVNSLYCDGGTAIAVFTDRQCQLLASAGLSTARTFQLAFNPNNGGPKNMCIGTWNNSTPVTDGKLRLVPCGVAADTVMILARRLPVGHTTAGYWMINGGSDNFSNPVVATSNGSEPRWETVDINGGRAVDTQEVRLTNGPFGPAPRRA